jgi:uncharacterized repeat protein (TIGR03803 family)
MKKHEQMSREFSKHESVMGRMCKSIAGLFLAVALLGVIGPERTKANPAFQTVHSFGLTDSLGIGLVAPVTQGTDGNLYGTVETGQDTGYGAVYQITTNGEFALVYSFTGNGDGAMPRAAVVQASDGYLYGTTSYGGINDSGTVYRVSTEGTFTMLYGFTNGTDGANPAAPLTQASDGNLYGTTVSGGASDSGTVFRISTNGAYALLYSFTGGADGGQPYAGLIQAADGYLYGTAYSGGTSGKGTVFRISTNGALTNLYSFMGGNFGGCPLSALVQGSNPNTLYGTTFGSDLDLSTVFRITTQGLLTNLCTFGGGDGVQGSMTFGNDGYLYGVTGTGGSYGLGTAFRIAFNGEGFAIVANLGGVCSYPKAGLTQAANGSFYGTAFWDPGTVFGLTTNSGPTILYTFAGNAGWNPSAPLVQIRDGNLYGTTAGGVDDSVNGTIFRIATNGTFTNLYSLTGGSDGAFPGSLVAASDGNLYGVTSYTLFRSDTNGGFTTIYTFTGGSDGSGPNGLIQASDGNLYGTTKGGGTATNGTVYRATTNGILTTLYSFTGGSDGGSPTPGMIQGSDLNLYGTTSGGGVETNGTVFRMTTNGVLTTLYAFTGGSDGAMPSAGVVQAKDGSLYGTAANGGISNYGTVFRITVAGAFSPVYSFTGAIDGAHPNSLMQASDGYFYGETSTTVFAVTTNGLLTTLHTFGTVLGGLIDGVGPQAGLMQATDGNLYGVAVRGGLCLDGTVFRIVLGASNTQPTLQFPTISAGNFTFAFPGTSGQSYTIQQTTNLATTNWTVYTNFTGTDSVLQLSVPATNSAQFFRIREP